MKQSQRSYSVIGRLNFQNFQAISDRANAVVFLALKHIFERSLYGGDFEGIHDYTQ
jgi:hypothetical protein